VCVGGQVQRMSPKENLVLKGADLRSEDQHLNSLMQNVFIL